MIYIRTSVIIILERSLPLPSALLVGSIEHAQEVLLNIIRALCTVLVAR